MDDKHLISIIIPSYNHEKFIPITIQSILDQTFKNFELIIVDDASQDNSRNIIKEYADKDARVKGFFNDMNQGIAQTLNRGLSLANGYFVALSSSDDVWHKEKLQRQIEILNQDDQLIVWSEGELIDEFGCKTGINFSNYINKTDAKKNGNIFNELLNGNIILGSSLILKKDCIRTVSYEEKLPFLNDYKFVLDLSYRYNFLFIELPLVFYRIHEENTHKKRLHEIIKDEITIRNMILTEYRDSLSWMERFKIHMIKFKFSYIYLKSKTISLLKKALF